MRISLVLNYFADNRIMICYLPFCRVSRRFILAVLICVITALAVVSCATTAVAARPNTFLDSVYARLQRGDLEGALSLFDSLSPEAAAKSSNLMVKASIYFSAGKLEKARETAALARENSSTTKDSLEAQFVLANIDGAEGKTKEQKAKLDAILKTDPVFVPALNANGTLALNNNELRNAAGYYDAALKVEPKNVDALTGRAQVFRLQRQPKEALRRLNEAVELYPNDAQVLAQRGRLLREMGNPKDSLVDLDKAKKIAPGDYWISYDRGRALLAMDKKRDALSEFENAEKINPNIFVSYVYSAGIKDELGEYKSAMRDYEALVKIKPDYYFGQEMLGVHYMREKRFDLARDAFRTAYEASKGTYSYAILSVINGLYAGGKPAQFKEFLEEIMRKADRSKIDYYVMRLFYDFKGDGDIAQRTNAEKDLRQKAKNLFYLASYYSVKGNEGLAQKLFNEFKGLQCRESLEWRIFEMVFETGGVKAANAATGARGNS
jgi:tetratricopeptide (TPR) repeat protein